MTTTTTTTRTDMITTTQPGPRPVTPTPTDTRMVITTPTPTPIITLVSDQSLRRGKGMRRPGTISHHGATCSGRPRAKPLDSRVRGE